MFFFLPVPPTIAESVPSNTSIIAAQRVILPCPVRGIPKPEISWFREDRELTGNEYGIRILGDGSLQLDNAQSKDAGQYHCVGANAAGNVTHFIHLRVFCKQF
jgi:hypothetical protein